jgi:hypothetical protein
MELIKNISNLFLLNSLQRLIKFIKTIINIKYWTKKCKKEFVLNRKKKIISTVMGDDMFDETSSIEEMLNMISGIR